MNEQVIQENISKVVSALNINYMPSSVQIRQSKISGLDNAISATGGYYAWAKKLNLSPKRKIIKREDRDIAKEILLLSKRFNRMPSKSEVVEYCGDESLHNAIARSYGYYEWAEKLNLNIKESETSMGVSYEDICFKMLEKKGYDIEKTPIKAPYDLIINGNVKIDVKSGCAYENNGSRVHTFGINKVYPTCDLYIIYALDESGRDVERILIIPSKYLKMNALNIGANSKYNKYLNKWDYIEQYDKFYQSLM